MGRARALGLALALLVSATLLQLPATALGHGDEEEATEALPARTLAQQALAVLTQADDPAEAREKLEAAIASEDQEGVDVAALRQALAASKLDNAETAIEHLNEALTPEAGREADEGGRAQEAPARKPAGEEAPEHQQMGGEEEEAPVAGALEHAEEFEPERGTAEWIALAVGIALVLAGVARLALLRRAVP